MDTSDGPLATLDQLMRLNNRGFRIELCEGRLHPAAQLAAATNQFPPWMMLAGPHGEFELVLTIPPERLSEFLDLAWEIKWHPLRLGKVIQSAHKEMTENGTSIILTYRKDQESFCSSQWQHQRIYLGTLPD